MKFKNKKIIQFSVLGFIFFVLGFFVNDFLTTSVDDLRVYHDSLPVDDKTLNLTNMIGLAAFEGSWQVVDSNEEIINSNNAVAIDCWLDYQSCYVAQANIIISDGFLSNSFWNGIGYYDIESWTEDGQIIAKTSSICEETILSADIKSKVVTLLEKKLEDADPNLCNTDGGPILMKLTSKNYSF